MKQFKLKADAPWPQIKFENGFVLREDTWVPVKEDIKGFSGVAQYVEYRDIEEEQQSNKPKRTRKTSEVPELPND